MRRPLARLGSLRCPSRKRFGLSVREVSPRPSGYALAVEEGEPGTVAIAAAFRAYEGADAPAAGTVSIAGPLARLTDERINQLAPMLLRAAREITRLWPLRLRQYGGTRDAGILAA